jgi:DNA polymerase delta subunit 3
MVYVTGEVIRTTARQATSPPTSDDGMAQDDMDVDEDMDVDDVPKKQRKPKAPKKIIPVGSNGLKKKRVVKTRTAFDAKGFMGG